MFCVAEHEAAAVTDLAELIVDSDIVANVCPPEFGAEHGYAGQTSPKLYNANHGPLKCYGGRRVPIKLRGENRTWVEAVIVVTVANVAYPVLSVGEMLLTGYTGAFAPTGCITAKNGCRIVVEQRGKTLIVEGRLAVSSGASKIGNPIDPTRGLGPERPNEQFDPDRFGPGVGPCGPEGPNLNARGASPGDRAGSRVAEPGLSRDPPI